VDGFVGTLVLCSVADPDRALGEIRRILKPGGRYAFIEHVAADDDGRLRWQRRLEPIWKRIAGNCHLCRRTGESIVRHGFAFDWMRRESIQKGMPLVRPSVRGVAIRS
jgi:ubiquinone/menaquinone biosynthesis C-methylase UbiE